MADNSPLVSKSVAETHRITCPHCAIGWHDILVERWPDKTIQIHNYNDPRKCGFCKRDFFLKIQMLVRGVTQEEKFNGG